MAGEWLYQRDPKFFNLVQWWGPTPSDILGRECDTPPLGSNFVGFGGHNWITNKKISISHNNNELKITIAKEPPIGTAGCRLFEISDSALTVGRRSGIDYDPSAIFDWQDWTLTQTEVSRLGYILELNRYYLPSKLYSRHTIYRRCPYAYRGSSCGYNGTARYTVENQPTTNPSLDVCNKTISACSLRFGNEAARFGGLDIVGPNPVGTVHVVPELDPTIGPRLYMVGEAEDFLSVLDPDNGIAGRVGSSVKFGQNIENPQGLAAIGNVLFLLDGSRLILYTVNLKTGSASRVANINNFGANVLGPTGLTSIDNTLYLVSTTPVGLYSVDDVTSVATKIGSSANFGIGENLPRGIASIGNDLFIVGSRLKALIKVNKDTGVGVRVGSSVNFGVSASNPQALTSIGNQLFMLDSTTDALYRIDPTTGIGVRVGGVSQFGTSERLPTGLAYIPFAPEPDPFDPSLLPQPDPTPDPDPDPDPEPPRVSIVRRQSIFNNGQSGSFVVPSNFVESDGLAVVVVGGGGGGGNSQGGTSDSFLQWRWERGTRGSAGGRSTLGTIQCNGGAGGGAGAYIVETTDSQSCPADEGIRFVNTQDGQSNQNAFPADSDGGNTGDLQIRRMVFSDGGSDCQVTTSLTYYREAVGGNVNTAGGVNGNSASGSTGGASYSSLYGGGGRGQRISAPQNVFRSFILHANSGGGGGYYVATLTPRRGDVYTFSVGRGGTSGGTGAANGSPGVVAFEWNEQV